MLHDYIAPNQRFIACPNQVVAYGVGFFDLDSQPAVIRVPDFGDRFWVYAAYDQRTDQFGEMGKPSGSEPGFYLLVGPNWTGEVPDGITQAIRSSTSLANIGPRVFLNVDEAVKAESEVIAAFLEWKHNGKPAGNGWNRSVNNADWGVDYYNRTGTSRLNMFDNRPTKTQYFYTDNDGA